MPRKTKYEGKWLNLYETSFTNAEGESREWEYAARTGTDGAAGIIAIVPGDIPSLVLVKQFRPPIDNFAVEFPAGLIDPGESITAAATRELQEETGYYGDVVNVGPPIYSSPGLTNEFVSTRRSLTRSLDWMAPGAQATASIPIALMRRPGKQRPCFCGSAGAVATPAFCIVSETATLMVEAGCRRHQRSPRVRALLRAPRLAAGCGIARRWRSTARETRSLPERAPLRSTAPMPA